MQPEDYKKLWEKIESRLQEGPSLDDTVIPSEEKLLESAAWWCLVGEDLKEKMEKI